MSQVLYNKLDVYQLLSVFILNSNKEKIEILLDDFIEEAILKDDYSFSTGLLGAGWLISFLNKQDMIDVDEDNVLYDVDDNIYKLTIKAIVSINISIDELLELISYYHQRILNKSKYYNFYRRFALFECLKLLVDKVSSIMAVDTSLSHFEKSKILLKYSYLITTSFSENEVEVLFYKTIEELISYYQSIKPNNFKVKDIEALNYLLLTSRQYANPYWIKCIEIILKQIDLKYFGLESLARISAKYLPNEENHITKDLLDLQVKNKLVFLLASNLKSFTFQNRN